jgi:uncharacterized surface protein with fasciclin (FAS1) repeats
MCVLTSFLSAIINQIFLFMLFSIIKKTAVILGAIALVASTILTPSASALSNNIVQTAIAAPDFSTLVAAVTAAGLADTLSGTGPSSVLTKLLLPENKDVLVKILTYHVVAGAVDADTIVTLPKAQTLEGSFFDITVVDGKIKINTDTNVRTTDINTSNGIIHSIDSVLIPQGVNLSTLKPLDVQLPVIDNIPDHPVAVDNDTEEAVAEPVKVHKRKYNRNYHRRNYHKMRSYSHR